MHDTDAAYALNLVSTYILQNIKVQNEKLINQKPIYNGDRQSPLLSTTAWDSSNECWGRLHGLGAGNCRCVEGQLQVRYAFYSARMIIPCSKDLFTPITWSPSLLAVACRETACREWGCQCSSWWAKTGSCCACCLWSSPRGSPRDPFCQFSSRDWNLVSLFFVARTWTYFALVYRWKRPPQIHWSRCTRHRCCPAPETHLWWLYSRSCGVCLCVDYITGFSIKKTAFTSRCDNKTPKMNPADVVKTKEMRIGVIPVKSWAWRRKPGNRRVDFTSGFKC